MQVATRSYLIAGVALTSVGVLALAPISPKLPDVELPPLSTMAPAGVGLTATTNPAEAWLKVFQHGFGDVTQVGASVAADPGPVLRQFLDNQVGVASSVPVGTDQASQAFLNWTADVLTTTLQTVATIPPQSDPVAAVAAISSALGNVELVSSVLSDVLQLPIEITGKLVNVVTAVVNVQTMLSLLVAAVGPLQAVVTAGVDTAEVVLDKLSSGDETAALAALVAAPLVIGSAFLNGYKNDNGTLYPGIFTVNTDNPATGGIFQLLLITLPRAIATALGLGPATDGKTSPQDVGAVPDPAARTVTLDTPAATPSVKRSGAASVKAKPVAEPDAVSAAAAPDTTSAVADTPIAKGGSKSDAPKKAAPSTKSSAGAPAGATKSSGSRTSRSSK
jgi:hypothetical protein